MENPSRLSGPSPALPFRPSPAITQNSLPGTQASMLAYASGLVHIHPTRSSKHIWMDGPSGWDVKIVCGNLEWHLRREKLIADSMFFRKMLMSAPEQPVATIYLGDYQPGQLGSVLAFIYDRQYEDAVVSPLDPWSARPVMVNTAMYIAGASIDYEPMMAYALYHLEGAARVMEAGIDASAADDTLGQACLLWERPVWSALTMVYEQPAGSEPLDSPNVPEAVRARFFRLRLALNRLVDGVIMYLILNKAFAAAFKNEWRDIAWRLIDDNIYFEKQRMLPPLDPNLRSHIDRLNAEWQAEDKARREAAKGDSSADGSDHDSDTPKASRVVYMGEASTTADKGEGVSTADAPTTDATSSQTPEADDAGTAVSDTPSVLKLRNMGRIRKRASQKANKKAERRAKLSKESSLSVEGSGSQRGSSRSSDSEASSTMDTVASTTGYSEIFLNPEAKEFVSTLTMSPANPAEVGKAVNGWVPMSSTQISEPANGNLSQKGQQEKAETGRPEMSAEAAAEQEQVDFWLRAIAKEDAARREASEKAGRDAEEKQAASA